MATRTDRALKRWEIHHPMILSAGTLGAVLWYGPEVFAYAELQQWHIDQLYTCVFTYSTVLTAFLFTFYTFIITGDRGFLTAARETIYFKQTIGYTMKAIMTGAVLSLASVPMLIVQPTPIAGDPWMAYAALWAALTVWSVASFVRAARLFAVFTNR